ncbi:MAG: tape measure protein [Lachnospiraceae bacterium]|nr:tape measure protein [Lachnospiraceae bacterium]
MAESYSIEAVLSARDAGFTAGMKAAGSATESLGQKLKSGIGFGAFAAIGQKAVSAVSSGVTGLIGDLSESSAAWKTFQGNMKMNGHAEKQIKSIKGELQKFAEQTIYSSSDMATTFAQLDAVGTKNTTNLVKGFGGLAAAAENPAQAMKTLSQQATQAAAKPKIQWEDFKLMLEQTPAGIAAVAKEMGMSTSEMIKKVQDGKIKTEDFFDAIAKVGTNKSFTKLATEYKTVGQAMDGLTETASNKLAPAFDVVSGAAIKGVSSIVDAMEGIDGDAIGKKVAAFGKNVSKYWNVLKTDALKIGSAFGGAIGTIGKSMAKLNGSFGSTESVNGFKSAMNGATGALTKFAGFCEAHSDAIAKLISELPKLLVAYKGFKTVKSIAPGVGAFGSAIGGLAKKGLSKIAPNLFKVSEAQEAVGKSSGASSKKILTSAKAFMMFGAGVLMMGTGFSILAKGATELASSGSVAIAIFVGMAGAVSALSIGMLKMVQSVSATPKKLTSVAMAFMAIGASILMASTGFWLLSNAAINLASAGAPAIAVMIGMVGAIAGLAVGASILGPALTAGAAGFIAFGAGIALVGAGALLASAALYVMAAVLPVIVQYGTSGAIAIAALGAGMIVFGAGAVVAGAASIVLGVGLLAVGAGSLAAAVGVLALGAATVVLGAGCLIAGAGIALFAAGLPVIASSGVAGAGALVALGAGMIAFSVGAVAGGAACVALGAGLAVVGAGALVASAGVLVLAAGALLLGTGMAVIAVSATVIAASLTATAAGAVTSAAAFTTLLAVALPVGVALVAASAGFLAFGVAALTSGAGVALLAAGFIALSAGLTISAAAISVMAASFSVVAVGATTSASAITALLTVVLPVGAALATTSAGFLVFGAGALSATAGVAAFGAAMIAGAAGTLVMAVSLKAVNSSMNSISSNAKSAQSSLSSMQGSVNAVNSGLNALGSKASAALNKLTSSFKNAASNAKSSGQKVGTGFTDGMKSGLNKAPSVASTAVKNVASKLKSGYSAAHSAGAYISKGFASGMSSCLGQIKSAAAQMVAAADAAIRAKAKIHSPSRLTKSHGRNIAIGLGIGIKNGINSVKKASKTLVEAAFNTMQKATKTRKYEDAAKSAIDTFKDKMNDKVSKTTKSLNKQVDSAIKKLKKKNPKLKKQYTKVGKILKSDISSTIKKQGQKAIDATDKALTALGEKYQEKYDKIVSDRENYLSKLSDYGDLYSVDSYGFVALKDFKAQKSQVEALAKNMEHLKNVLPYDLMRDIQDMDTSSALAYTNELLKKGDSWLKQYGKDYTSFMNTSKTASDKYYQPYIDKLDKDYNKAVTDELKKLEKQLNDIGKQAVTGFTKGLTSKSSKKALKKAAKDLASILTKSVKGKLKIHSPSRVFMLLGEYVGKGFANGIYSMGRKVKQAMESIVTIPDVQTPVLAGGFGSDLSADYEYYRNTEYTIVVPVEIDGRETARVTAPYTEAELNKRQKRYDRNHGRR